MSKPQFSYNRLAGDKAIVTCACGWRDPLGPIHPSMFDPAESLAAAQAAHPVCSTQPANITEQTTLAELSAQRDLLGVTALMLFTNLDGTRTALAQHPSRNSFLGQGTTEAAAIEAAFAQLRRATLPAPLKAIVESTHNPIVNVDTATLVGCSCGYRCSSEDDLAKHLGVAKIGNVVVHHGAKPEPERDEHDDYDRATGDLGRPLWETKK